MYYYHTTSFRLDLLNCNHQMQISFKAVLCYDFFFSTGAAMKVSQPPLKCNFGYYLRYLPAQHTSLSMSTHYWRGSVVPLDWWTFLNSAACRTRKIPSLDFTCQDWSSGWVMVHLSAFHWLKVTWGKGWRHLSWLPLLVCPSIFKKMTLWPLCL